MIELRRVSKGFVAPEWRRRSVAKRLTHWASGQKPELRWALRGIDLEVSEGEAIGIVGPNGSGKTTLLKLIAGIYRPTEGTVTVRDEVTPLFHWGLGFQPDLTGEQNVRLYGAILGMERDRILSLLPRIAELSGLGDAMKDPLRTYSLGMRYRLAFSTAVQSPNRIFLCDEGFSGGDLEFQETVTAELKRLRRDGVTLLLASHGLELVSGFCDRALWLDHGQIRGIGDPAQIVARYRSGDLPPSAAPLSAARTASQQMLIETLQTEGKITIPVEGTSMQPELQPGDRVEVRKIDPATLAPGDVVMFRDRDSWVIHTLKRVERENGEVRFVTQGENTLGEDPAFAKEDLLGIVKTCKRN